jgi:outer membrane protein OmpA-like peptidoglycan-associated protein
MRQRYLRVLLTILVILLVSSVAVFAQQQETKKRLYAPSLDGLTGLFRAWDAESLRAGEVNFSLGYSHLNRDPGELVIKTAPVSFSVGIWDRLEFFASIDPYKRIQANSIQTYRLLPGQLPRPASTLTGVTSFSNDAPFIDVPDAQGRGDFRFGMKGTILSERAGQPFTMGLVGFAEIPPDTSATSLNRGLGHTGTTTAGVGYLFSKNVGKYARLHLNTILDFVGNPEINGNRLGDLQNEFWYRGGASFPAYGRLNLIAEIDGKSFFGSRMAGSNPTGPIDLIAGLRYFVKDWMSFGLGYRATLNHIDENTAARVYPAGTNGFVAQFAVGMRRNDPPTVSCAVANASIKQDEKTTVRANATDPNGDPLTFSWASSGGKVTGKDDTVEFDATGVAPGRYTVTATVSDGKLQSNCTAEITVIKKNLPPSVSCEPSRRRVTQGETATISATATDPNNDKLTYGWSVNGEKLAADGSTLTFGSAGRKPGDYTVTVTVNDGEFGASCSSTVTVVEAVKPNTPPKIECLTTTVDVASGGSIELKAQASDPDGDRLTITWSSTGGSVNGSGGSATFNAAGVKAGSYTVTVAADDGRGGKASCSMTVNVSEKLTFGPFAHGSARVDNVMKAALDDLATRMKNDSRLKANIIGYNEGTKAEPKKIGELRAKAVAEYLKKKGVEESRLTITDGGGANPIGDAKQSAGRKQNRRVEVELAVR